MKSFTPLFIIAICIGAYFLYISPTYSAAQTLSTQKDNYNKVLSQVKDVSAKRDQVLATYNAIPADSLARLAKIVPADFNPITFASHLNAVANKYGLIVDKIRIIEQDADNGQVEASPAGSYKTRKASFSVSGQYMTLMNFFKDLESGLYLVNVTGLSVKKDQSDKSGSTLEFDFSLNTYSLN